MRRSSHFVALCLMLGVTSQGLGVPVSLELQLTAPVDLENVLTLTASTVLGSDTQASVLSGTVSADIEVLLGVNSAEATAMTFTGGKVLAGDVTFSLLGGLVTATGTGLAATPSTPSPPGLVSGEAFAAGSTDSLFDVNGDGAVSQEDYAFWTERLMETLPGDANLDFAVDASDFNQWNAHKFTFATGVCAGDFSGDSIVDLSDFNIWNDHKFLSVGGPRAVPEPATGVLTAWWVCSLVGLRRWKSGGRAVSLS